MAANIDLRRRQMWGVYCHVHQAGFQQSVEEVSSIALVGFLSAALAAGECRSIREALRKRVSLQK